MKLISDACGGLCLRIRRLQENENLEEAPRAVLKHLGELKRPYLTAVEEKLLSVVEQEYSNSHFEINKALTLIFKLKI